MPHPSVSVLYIAGAGRSGSTLLELLLARRSRLVPVGEVRFLWQRGVVEDHLCSCGRAFSACPFWDEVLDRAYGDRRDAVAADMLDLDARLDRMRRIPQMRVRALRRDGFEADFERYGRQLAQLYRAVLDVSGAAAVIDSLQGAAVRVRAGRLAGHRPVRRASGARQPGGRVLVAAYEGAARDLVPGAVHAPLRAGVQRPRVAAQERVVRGDVGQPPRRLPAHAVRGVHPRPRGPHRGAAAPLARRRPPRPRRGRRRAARGAQRVRQPDPLRPRRSRRCSRTWSGATGWTRRRGAPSRCSTLPLLVRYGYVPDRRTGVGS